MIEGRQNFDHLAHHPLRGFDRLIGVSIGADRNGRHLIAFRPKLPLQYRPDPRPGDQSGFKIQPRRQVQKRMAWPGKTIDATMFAAPVGIDGAVKGQIGRPVIGQRRTGAFQPHLGRDQPFRFRQIPTVIKSDMRSLLKPTCGVRRGPACAQALTLFQCRIADFHGKNIEHKANIRNHFLRPFCLLSAFAWGMSENAKCQIGFHRITGTKAPKERIMSDDEIILSELNDEELVLQMHDDLYDGLKEEIEEGVNLLIARGWTPYDVLTKALVAGMTIVGADFRDGILFVPEVLLAANAMKAGMHILKPLLAETGAPRMGKMVIGTVKGDIHDIGKNLVAMMMEGAGFEVVDLGINNAVEKYLEALETEKPDILGMSALLTTTMPYMKVVIDTMKEKGLRDDYIVLVGGAPLNEEFGKAIGADAYCRDAAVAVETAKTWVSRKHNQMGA